jgi:glycosyltransferase involved in cell wall biosynthesis
MNLSKPTLSVIVITKNEEHDLPRCLRSVWFADEIVVLDSGSTDRTVEIAREFTDKVFVSEDWPGFGQQKNRALSYATQDWVLSLDADEWVTADLAKEIRAAISNGDLDVYQIPRLSSFCGKVIRHSGWYPDYVTRLFKRTSAGFSEDLVHERVVHEASVGTIRQPLRHESYHDIKEVMEKSVRYVLDGAENRFQKGERTTFFRAVLSGLWAFSRSWILRLGFLDGKAGFQIALMAAESSFYRHVRMLELQGKSIETDS